MPLLDADRPSLDSAATSERYLAITYPGGRMTDTKNTTTAANPEATVAPPSWSRRSKTLRAKASEGLAEVHSQGHNYTMKAGDMMIIPPNDVFHFLEDTIDIDIFAPGRQDWLDGTATYLNEK